MNYNESNRDNSDFNSRRSDRYRHPEQDRDMRSNNYGPSNRSSNGNTNRMSRNHDQRDDNRDSSSRGSSDLYSSSRNYGNMGSYGGAQGFGSARGGYPSQRHQDSDYNSNFVSGMGNRNEDSSHQRRHGYERDFDSHGGGSGVREISYKRDNALYGDDTSRRFQGDSHNRYNFDMDNNSRSNSYGGSDGNYMGSGYSRTSRPGEYGSMNGDSKSTGSYSRERYNSPENRNRNYRGGYGPSSDYGNNRDRDIRDYDRY